MSADRDREASLPDLVVVGRDGAYWRDFGDFYSMCPVSTDNDPVVPIAFYVRVGQVDVHVLIALIDGYRARLAADPEPTEAGT